MKKSQTPAPASEWYFRPMVRWFGFTEAVDPTSLTQPDQVKGLDLILQHRNQGIPSPMFNGVYLGEDSNPLELNKLDSCELLEFRLSLLDQIEELQKDFHESTRMLAEIQSAPKPPSGGQINALSAVGASPDPAEQKSKS